MGENDEPAPPPPAFPTTPQVNAVIAESLVMACAQVAGNHTTITICAAGGNFELNASASVSPVDRRAGDR